MTSGTDQWGYLSVEIEGEALVGIFEDWAAMWQATLDAQNGLPPDVHRQVIFGPDDEATAVALMRASCLAMHPTQVARHRDIMLEARDLIARFLAGASNCPAELEQENAELRAEVDQLRRLLAGVVAVASQGVVEAEQSVPVPVRQG